MWEIKCALPQLQILDSQPVSYIEQDLDLADIEDEIVQLTARGERPKTDGLNLMIGNGGNKDGTQPILEEDKYDEDDDITRQLKNVERMQNRHENEAVSVGDESSPSSVSGNSTCTTDVSKRPRSTEEGLGRGGSGKKSSKAKEKDALAIEGDTAGKTDRENSLALALPTKDINKPPEKSATQLFREQREAALENKITEFNSELLESFRSLNSSRGGPGGRNKNGILKPPGSAGDSVNSGQASTQDSDLTGEEPDERDLVAQSIKVTRQNFWKRRPGNDINSYASHQLAIGARPFTATDNYMTPNSSQGYPNPPSTSYPSAPAKRPHTMTSGASSGSFNIFAGTNHVLAGIAGATGEEEGQKAGSELTQGDEVFAGSNPLRAIRKRRANMGLNRHYSTGNQNLHHMLQKFQSYLAPNSELGKKLAETKKVRGSFNIYLIYSLGQFYIHVNFLH